MGKPIGDARWEANHVADTLRYYAGAADKFFGETIQVAKAGLDLTLRQPLGVVGLIVPWNFPMVIATWKLGPALATRQHRSAQARQPHAAHRDPPR